jgi:hypothetical protein
MHKNENKSEKKNETSAEQLTLHLTMTQSQTPTRPERSGKEAMTSPSTRRTTNAIIAIEAEAQHVITTYQDDHLHTSPVGITAVNVTR